MHTTTQPPAARRPSRRGLVIAVLVIAGSVALLLALVDMRTVAAQLRQADVRVLAAASAALLAGNGLYALRWRLLLGGRPTWADTFFAACVGHAINTLVPLRLGEPARIVALGRRAQLPYSEVTSAVVVERLWEQVMRLAALAAAVAVGAGLALSPGVGAGGLAGLLAAALLVAWLRRRPAWVLARVPSLLARLPRVDEARARQSIERLLAGLALATSRRRLAQGALTSVGAWGLYALFHALALAALPLPLDRSSLLAVALATLALAPPSAPTAPGLYHASLVVPLALLGFPETALAAYAIVLHALLMAWMLPLGAVGLARSGLAAGEVLPAREAP